MKTIQFIQSNTETKSFLTLMASFGVKIYTHSGSEVDFSKSDMPAANIYYIAHKSYQPIIQYNGSISWIANRNECMEYSITGITTYGYYIFGSLALLNENCELKEVFNSIVQFVKREYKISQDKHYYLSPEMYDLWQNMKGKFSFMFRYETVAVKKELFDESAFDNFLREKSLLKKAVAKTEDHVICFQDADLYMFGKDGYDYLPESECIFVSTVKKRGESLICFFLDKRHFDNKNEKIVEAFNDIKNYFNDFDFQ